MKSEKKRCQNCKTEFTIESEDFEFYQKIGVPAPTFCPECRAQRRFAYKTDLFVYKRKDDYSGKMTFSDFSPKNSVKVYDQKIWDSDKWDPMDYGHEYDWNKPFFEQIDNLFQTVPWPSRVIVDTVNCDYCKSIIGSKNSYLVMSSADAENCAYGYRLVSSKDSFDSMHLKKSELCYQGLMLNNCYKTFFSSYCDDCQETIFCYNCVGCSNCFGCANLKHGKYQIFNKQYSKEEYFEKLKEFNIGSFSNLEKLQSQANQNHLKYPRKFMFGRHNVDVTGEYIYNSKNVHDSYTVTASEDARYCQLIETPTQGVKYCYDNTGYGQDTHYSYECIGTGKGVNNSKFCRHCFISCLNLEYCSACSNCSDCFACVGLRKKQYCIFNKQYTKQEYEELVPKIKKHMNEMPYTDKRGNVYKYGEFFPIEISIFEYSETIANDFFPLTRKQSLKQGYKWYDKPKPEYKATIKAKDLPDDIKEVDSKMLKEVIECGNKNCSGSTVFRLIPQELKFLKKMNLPLPRQCPECRVKKRTQSKNPMKLWHRKCMKKGCQTEFETSYSPDRKEIVYCEKCYLKEIG